MDENKKINKSTNEEPIGAAYSSSKKGVVKRPPPYNNVDSPYKNSLSSNSLKAPANPYQKYYVNPVNDNEKKKQNDGLFTPSFNSSYLEKKTPISLRAQQEEQFRNNQIEGFENTKNNHFSELDYTNNMVGADRVSKQYQAIMNPIGNSIASGKTPYNDSADRNQAVMASTAVYGGESKIYAPTEWEPSDMLNGKINEEYNENTGFKFQLFEKEEENEKNVKEKRYMLAFAGTEDLKDWETNYAETKGLSTQHKDAASLARVVVNMVGGADKVIFVGHSLGGGLASTAAYATGSNAITFNAAAVSELTKDNLKDKYKDIDINGRESNIKAYVNAGEILDFANRMRGLKADGNLQYVRKKGESNVGKGVEKHGIENFFEIFNIDDEKLKEDYLDKFRANIPENFVDEYENKPPSHIPEVKDYSGGLGTY
jgi:hypothetical protein